MKKLIKHFFKFSKIGLHYKIKIFNLKINLKKKYSLDREIFKYKINPRKIFFKTFNNSFTCNPKYIANKILEKNLPYELVWGVNSKKPINIDSFPSKIKVVKSGTKEYKKEFASSKFIIVNGRIRYELIEGLLKKPEQVYIQTWHGSLGIKKTGQDIHSHNNKIIRHHKIDAEYIDYITSNSTFTDKLFKQIFFNNGEILKFGHPRNDIFFKTNLEIKEKVYKELGISLDKHIVLYAPTFRDSESLEYYQLDFDNLRKAFESKFDGEWEVVTRLHPRLISLQHQYNLLKDSNIKDATKYPDIQELLVSVDAIITDYSSCIYDFMLTHKPGFIYATDIAEYSAERGLYYPLESTPFPIATNNKEMIKNIENFNLKKYIQDVDTFLKNKNCIDNGSASDKVVELLEKIIEKDEGETND